MSYKKHTNCRVCNSDKLVSYLSLGNLPLTNNLCKTIDEVPLKYPLNIMVCQECWHSQLSIVVDPEIMFRKYVYRSSISKEFLNHCKDMAIDLMDKYKLNSDSFHIDIAGNDGALLDQFNKVLSHKILNVDPAINMAEICYKKEITTLTYFWSSATAKMIARSFGKADIITATNVIAHLDNLHDFFTGIKIMLKETGVFVIECPYLIPFIENNEFPTLYQEHVSIMSVSPIDRLCKEFGLTLMKVEEFDIHCGSIRMHIGYGEQDDSVRDYINKEEKYQTIEPYIQFGIVSKQIIVEFYDKLKILKNSGYTIGVFGASAKCNTLLNAAGVNSDIVNAIYDETPEKIGMYAPNTKIKIFSLLDLKESPPDFLILGAYNFTNELIRKALDVGYKGKFIHPIPHFKIIAL